MADPQDTPVTSPCEGKSWLPPGLKGLLVLASLLALLPMLLTGVTRMAESAVPGRAATPDSGQLTAAAVAAGGFHTCALREDGTVVCWGDNEQGQLGDGATMGRTAPVVVEGLTDATAVAAGWQHTCAVREAGTVVCWGDNEEGQLGDGTTMRRTNPVEVDGLVDAVAVTGGGSRTCALRRHGAVACWGLNEFRQLEDGPTTRRTAPADVNGLVDAVAVAASGAHTCALREGGAVACWGKNEFGQLGDGTTTRRTAPAPVDGLADIVGLSAAEGGMHTCALRRGGAVVCWGGNSHWQVGSDRFSGLIDTPIAVGRPGWRQRGSLADAVAVTAGGGHSCVVRQGGSVACWGQTGMVPLEDAHITEGHVPPVVLGGLDDAVAVAAGGAHTCALREGGSVACWGENGQGQLGDGTTTRRGRPTPVAAAGQ